jgi:hypothetical protein
MSDLYSVIPALSPTSDEIITAELLAKQILEAQYPDLDLREGTGLRDLVLRPTAYAFALLKKATDYYFANNTLAGVNDTTDTEIIDDLLSNWFMARHTGTSAVIGARLYFATQKNVTIPSNTYFSPDNTLRYFPSTTLTFQPSALALDTYSNEWYVDVALVAEKSGSAYNLGEGSLLYFGNFDPYFLRGEISYLSQSAADAETNSQFIARSQNAISTRNLINVPSVASNLQSAFNTLSRVHTVGMGDPDMIRDQIRVVIDPEAARTISAMSVSGTTATITLANHGFQVGQLFNIVGALPSGYNGQFAVTSVISLNQFTFTIAGSLGGLTALPQVQSYTAPTLAHTGGKVDIYVGDTVSSTITQFTTDANGRVTITGPVYQLARSNVTGGSNNDTIPFSASVAIASSTFDGGLTKLQVTTSTPHGLTSGTPITVAGLSQTKSISSLNCVNLIVTAVSAGHGLSTGMSVTVAGATPSTYNGTYTITVLDANTFTYVVSSNILSAAVGTITMTNPAVDGAFAITNVGSTTFDVLMSTIWAGATNSYTGVAITYSPTYAVINPNLQTVTLQSMSGAGTIATASLNNHGLSANRFVTISGATPSYYNGTFKILDVPSPGTFRLNIGAPLLANPTGTIQCTYTTPWKDYGFSQKQSLIADFGTGYANSTVSFQTASFDRVHDVQAYLDAPAQHILCGDYLARGYNLYVLNINVCVYNASAPTTGLVQTTAAAYLATLGAGATFMLSDLVAALNTAGITNIQTPLGVTYTYYHRDLITPKTGTITDFLDPQDSTNIFVLGSVTSSSVAV